MVDGELSHGILDFAEVGRSVAAVDDEVDLGFAAFRFAPPWRNVRQQGADSHRFLDLRDVVFANLFESLSGPAAFRRIVQKMGPKVLVRILFALDETQIE